VIGERIRNKIAASKRKGMWMGGVPPIVYNVCERRLVVNPSEAATVRQIFERYLELGSVRCLKEHLEQRGVVSKLRVAKNGVRWGGCAFSRGALYKLLANPLYRGAIPHRKECYPGQHEAIVQREVWEKTQRQLSHHAVRRGAPSNGSSSSPLAGKLFAEAGEPLYVAGASKGSQRYRYYVSRQLSKASAAKAEEGWRLAAPEIERNVLLAIRQLLRDQAAISEVLQEAAGTSAVELAAALKTVAATCVELETRPESATTIFDALERVDLSKHGIKVTLNLARLLAGQVAVPADARFLISRCVSLQLKRRGVELRLVLKGEETSVPRSDPALLKAIARGHSWFAEFARGGVSSTREIAQREGLTDSYVRRLVRLAFLSPTIIETICTGRQPIELTVQGLTRGATIPLSWQDQLQALRLA
jgi:site-specific DNA recombinase